MRILRIDIDSLQRHAPADRLRLIRKIVVCVCMTYPPFSLHDFSLVFVLDTLTFQLANVDALSCVSSS